MPALLLFALAVAATPPVESTPSKPEGGKKVCKYENRIGTLSGRRRVCRTAAEWDEIAARARDTYRDLQGAQGSSHSYEPDLIRPSAQPQ